MRMAPLPLLDLDIDDFDLIDQVPLSHALIDQDDGPMIPNRSSGANHNQHNQQQERT